MDICNFFKKSSVENQNSIESSKLEHVVERYDEVDREQLSGSSNSKSSNVLLQGKTFKEIKLEPQRNANGMMIILCMGFIKQRKKC